MVGYKFTGKIGIIELFNTVLLQNIVYYMFTKRLKKKRTKELVRFTRFAHQAFVYYNSAPCGISTHILLGHQHTRLGTILFITLYYTNVMGLVPV